MQTYNITKAAKKAGIGRTMLHAMIKAGLKLSHGRRTTLQPIYDFQKENPGFKIAHAYSDRPEQRGRRRGWKAPTTPTSTQTSSPAGKSGEPSSKHD